MPKFSYSMSAGLQSVSFYFEDVKYSVDLGGWQKHERVTLLRNLIKWRTKGSKGRPPVPMETPVVV